MEQFIFREAQPQDLSQRKAAACIPQNPQKRMLDKISRSCKMVELEPAFGRIVTETRERGALLLELIRTCHKNKYSLVTWVRAGRVLSSHSVSLTHGHQWVRFASNPMLQRRTVSQVPELQEAVWTLAVAMDP